jgi:hypothetical protein
LLLRRERRTGAASLAPRAAGEEKPPATTGRAAGRSEVRRSRSARARTVAYGISGATGLADFFDAPHAARA